MVNQLGNLRVSCKVFTTLDNEFMISSFELKRAYISLRRCPKLVLKSLKVLLWNSVAKTWSTFVELALGCQFVVGVGLEFFYFHVAVVSFLFELFFQQEEGFVEFAHILFLALDASLFFLFDSLISFCIVHKILSNFYLVSFCPS